MRNIIVGLLAAASLSTAAWATPEQDYLPYDMAVWSEWHADPHHGNSMDAAPIYTLGPWQDVSTPAPAPAGATYSVDQMRTVTVTIPAHQSYFYRDCHIIINGNPDPIMPTCTGLSEKFEFVPAVSYVDTPETRTVERVNTPDIAVWSDWNNGRETGGVTEVTFGTWSNWSDWVNDSRTRTRTVTTSISAVQRVDFRSCGVNVRDIPDSPAPICSGNSERVVIVAPASVSTITETQTENRTPVNGNWYDGINLTTLGTTDAGGANYHTDSVYDAVGVTGVKEANHDGWTGLGQTAVILDGGFNIADGHGRVVSDIFNGVAPGAERVELSGSSDGYGFTDAEAATVVANIETSDVFTTSIGVTGGIRSVDINGDGIIEHEIDGSYARENEAIINALETNDIVATVAAQHSNWRGDRNVGDVDGDGADDIVEGRGLVENCPNTAQMNISNCNSWYVNGLEGDNVIFVGEVDAAGNIPSWSNQAGQGAVDGDYNFLVTLSNALTSADHAPEGNSFAAPRVAGAAALVRHKFSETTAAQVVDILTNTADDLGASGVDSVYGHGRLNVAAALSPIGELN